MAIQPNPKTLDLADIQGMVTRGYSKLYKTAYFSLAVTEAESAKKWLSNVLPEVDSADDHKIQKDRMIHLAFGYQGLKNLGMFEENVDTFPLPFREGISTPNRNRILGDWGTNAPESWRWGGGNEEEILLIFHAKDDSIMEEYLQSYRDSIVASGGLSIRNEMLGHLRPDNKEPFGFHDGISQPVIKGCGRKAPELDLIEPGEFLLGYKNEHGRFPDSPLVKKEQGDTKLLSDDVRNTGLKDIGRNGTFMVFRQMQQHVDAFWKSMEQHTLNPDGSVNEEAKIRLASKCVGRWPSGASLVNFPDGDPGGSHTNDDFGYADTDPDGMKCPFGSHLRRNNPRDQVRWYGKKQSLKVSNRHRIIRRGRIYELPADGAQESEIGLHFICFNANIELQFEFIQHTWSNDNQTGELSNDLDVLIGMPEKHNPDQSRGQFTVQNKPVNEYYEGWEQFTTIKGGAYYFFPSLSTLKYLTTI
ncbi:MAG: peroxidase [Crocinitomicaceae bacterium]